MFNEQEQHAALKMDIVGSNGTPFRVLTDGRLVEFRDLRFRRAAFGENGQGFGASYYASDILGREPYVGLNLYGGNESWSIDGEAMEVVKAWLRLAVVRRWQFEAKEDRS